jgi:hypothetical protein
MQKRLRPRSRRSRTRRTGVRHRLRLWRLGRARCASL